MGEDGNPLTETLQGQTSVSVIVCAYTMDRWELLQRAVESVLLQSHQPKQLIVCIDHNPDLYSRAAESFADSQSGSTQVLVVENLYVGRLGGARTTASHHATGDVLAFLDDDARASSTWLEQLLRVYAETPGAAVVGGAPQPDFAVPPPSWFPEQFYWVFGCHYKGLPETRQPVGRVIGANMSVRRAVLEKIGGFRSDNHDDMYLCHSAAHLCGEGAVWYEPAAVVQHHVGSDRLKWAYFWRRCFFVNRGKVAAMAVLGEAGGHAADVSFALGVLSGAWKDAFRLGLRGNLKGFERAVVCLLGLSLAAAGNAAGTWQLRTGKTAVPDPLQPEVASAQLPTTPGQAA